jgi:NAD(P)-dependent dehydrogenase (short-subunit alcohol dehydrogenase family)
MGALDGRVAIITGAGRGLGREHALLFAREGAKVVVNDLGGAADGTGDDRTAAQQVADEITAAGGEAVANGDSVASWEGAQRLVNTAIEAFGDLDVLVNNAGILRDRVVVNMTEEEWDAVIAVHLKGHFAPTRWAAAYWREQHKAGVTKPRNLVHTSSTSGLFSNPGQANYGAAKSGIATLSQICAKELSRYGVKSNCIAPAARTRLTLATPGLSDILQPPAEEGVFDIWDPANVSPLVAYLATAECPFNGETFFVQGGEVRRVRTWEFGESVEQGSRWTVGGLSEALAPLAPVTD